jgi:hypothetical protein
VETQGKNIGNFITLNFFLNQIEQKTINPKGMTSMCEYCSACGTRDVSQCCGKIKFGFPPKDNQRLKCPVCSKILKPCSMMCVGCKHVACCGGSTVPQPVILELRGAPEWQCGSCGALSDFFDMRDELVCSHCKGKSFSLRATPGAQPTLFATSD